MCKNSVFFKGFYQKVLFYAIFQSKSKSFHLSVLVFLYFGWLGVIYDSQAHNRIVAGKGGSPMESSLLPIFVA
jgi:hypothetical protein